MRRDTGNGGMRWSLAIKELTCSKATHTQQFVDEGLTAMKFMSSGRCEAVDYVVAYVSVECIEKA